MMFAGRTRAVAAGTDDQTAAEVSVDATAFSQNLTATDADVQTALETSRRVQPIPRGLAADGLASGGDRHPERRRLHLTGQQQHGDTRPRHRRNGPALPEGYIYRWRTLP